MDTHSCVRGYPRSPKGKRANPRMAKEKAQGSQKMKSQDAPFAGRHHTPLTNVGAIPKGLHRETKEEPKVKCPMFTMEMVVSLCSVRVLPPVRLELGHQS